MAHGTLGGLSQAAQGGDFFSGFISAGTVQAFSLGGGFEAVGVSDNRGSWGVTCTMPPPRLLWVVPLLFLVVENLRMGLLQEHFLGLFNDFAQERGDIVVVLVSIGQVAHKGV
ncbi:MAG: hypothetical protein R3F37_17310 [Candidatus Competibacteraceae bacterium]